MSGSCAHLSRRFRGLGSTDAERNGRGTDSKTPVCLKTWRMWSFLLICMQKYYSDGTAMLVRTSPTKCWKRLVHDYVILLLHK